MDKTFTYDNLGSDFGLKEGEYVLEIEDVKEVLASTGSYICQFTYKIMGTKLKLNYDNCPLMNAQGDGISFGQNKLKKILNAVGVSPKEFTIKSIRPLLIGKRFRATLSKGPKSYLELAAKDIDKIKSVSIDSNENNPVGEEEILITNEDTVDTTKWD